MMFIIAGLKKFYADSLYRNSIYLILSTFIMACFGFFFWIINARLYTTEQIGIATTFISIVGLISNMSLLGFGNTLIKFLPASNQKNEKINTAFTLISIVSVILGIIFIIGLPVFSPKLVFLRSNIWLAAFLALFMLINALNSITNSVFIAYRSAQYILIINTIMSATKLLLPIFLVGWGVYGILSGYIGSVMIATLLSFIYLVAKFKYTIYPTINKSILRSIGRFTFGNYLASIIGGLPSNIMPLIVTNRLGPKYTAYYFMSMMIMSLLYVIPQAATQSLFAEGSYNFQHVKKELHKTMNLIAFLMIPPILILVIFSKYLLLIFGKSYSSDGYQLLQILASSGLFVAINYIGGILLYIQHKVKQIITLSVFSTTLILSLTYFLLPYKLIGIGVAWIIGQGIISMIYIILMN